MTYPTFSNLYLFDLNTQDIFGTNDLTANGSPTYTKGIFDHAIVLNGSSQYLTASDNTKYDVTTEDFWYFGLIYRTSDSGGAEFLVWKQNDAAGTNPGYGTFINPSDQLATRIGDGSPSIQTITLTSTTIATNKWYAFGISYDRDGDGTIYLYDLATGTLYTTSASITNHQATITNTQTFTVARNSRQAEFFFPGRMDMLIPPQIGATLSQADFLALVETTRMLISKRDKDDNAITAFEARNFSVSTIRGQHPSEAVGDIVSDDESAILIKALGPQTTLTLEWTIAGEDVSAVFDDTSGTVDTVDGIRNYLYDTLAPHDSEQILEECTLTLYHANDKPFIRTGSITSIDVVKTQDQPITYKATMGFLVGTVS